MPETRNAGQPLPFGAVPAIGARHLAAAFETDQGRHDLDLKTVRDVEPKIGFARRHRFRETGVVLRIDRQRGMAGHFAEHRGGHHAGRAVALDDGNQTVSRHAIVRYWAHRDAPLPFRGSMNRRRRAGKARPAQSAEAASSLPARSRRFAATWRSPSQAASAVIVMKIMLTRNTDRGAPRSMMKPNIKGPTMPAKLNPVVTTPNVRPTAPGGAAARTSMSRDGMIIPPRNPAAAIATSSGAVPNPINPIISTIPALIP